MLFPPMTHRLSECTTSTSKRCLAGAVVADKEEADSAELRCSPLVELLSEAPVWMRESERLLSCELAAAKYLMCLMADGWNT